MLFKTHFWDEGVAENFAACKRFSQESDIFILFDSSNRKIDIPDEVLLSERVFLTPYSKVEALGLEWGMPGVGGGYWYNGDYQQNLFILDHSEYDYICSVENDVGIFCSLDSIFDDMAENGIDLVFLPQEGPNHTWSHLNGCIGYYDTNQNIRKGLFCISFFSRRAALHIVRRRIEMSLQRRQYTLHGWPIGEAVMVEEVLRAGMVARSIADYCDSLTQYDWAPAYSFREFDPRDGRTFVHPALPLNDKFYRSNFQQDYNALFSERNVISGKSRERARKINDLEVYSRLYTSLHMQWAEDRWRPLIEDAACHLSPDALALLHGPNLLTSDNAVVERESGSRAPNALCLSALPAWGAEQSEQLDVNERIRLIVSVSGDTQLLIGSESSDLAEALHMRALDADIASAPIMMSFRIQHRAMRFFSASIPAGTREVVIECQAPCVVNNIRLSNGQGSIADWRR
ncbi:hypothetical protein KGY14_07590 [Ameyamaea chiangmaiensis]|uniref:Uncharacterized protein n=1 Tax=Ameyamaea chiangmaiensis TaxID=442969 RepID=A0A850PIQ1_9PROT|nr:hypothetical protein [Ameyamaea chiangmaiensis]MBS4075051.1 hypothetical protein [Ameyamaea chiangmaiensis]NVN41131.1 hypothetical protein [Ameyamaea chiangmaiensis]